MIHAIEWRNAEMMEKDQQIEQKDQQTEQNKQATIVAIGKLKGAGMNIVQIAEVLSISKESVGEIFASIQLSPSVK